MKSLVIAVQTVQGYFRDRLFHAVLVFAVLLLFFSVFLATLTIAEPRKILLDFGLASVSLIGVGFALLTGSTIVRKEIDNRTIYTILAKPVSRTSYLLGKFAGGAVVVLAVHVVCGAVLAGVIYGLGDVPPPGFVAAIYLSALEALLLLALAITLSLAFSSLFLGAALSLAAFLLGRSNHSFGVLADKTDSPALKWLLRALRDLFPSLQRFDVRDVVAYGKSYPVGTVELSTLYFACFTIALLSLAAFFLRRKDLP